MPTKIEWVINSDGTKGKTWNPITGCTPVSVGCAHCYARRMARRLAGRYGYPKAPHHFDVTLHPGRLGIPLKRKKPTTYFVCSMSDLFHDDVPPSFICEIWQVMRECPQHTFQILTKRPQRMFEIITTYIADDALGFAPLPNVWGLITAENQTTADERIPWLLKTPFAVRGVSCEPLLGSIDLEIAWGQGVGDLALDTTLRRSRLDWVIAGGESGPGARPMHPDRARSLRDQCREAGIPYFFKQHGAWLHESQFTTDEQRGKGLSSKRCKAGDGYQFVRVGKKAAGHLLDSREHHEFPRTSVERMLADVQA